MLKFIAWRVVGLVLVIVAMVGGVFLLRQVIPTDPARAAVGPNAPAEIVQAKRLELGLDQPLYVQFWNYLKQLVHGDLGTSIRTHGPVADDVRHALPASVELLVAAVIFAVGIGVTYAILRTLIRRSNSLRITVLGIASMPIFLTAAIFLLVFWFHLDWFPSSGQTSISGATNGPTGLLVVDGILTGQLSVVGNAISHLVMPAVILALPMAVAIGRSLEGSLVNVSRQDYVRTARAKGFSEFRILIRHSLRNAATAPLAMLGLQIGLLFTNIIVVEQIFSWPGLGRYTAQALASSDLTAVLGVALVFGVAYVVINAVVDFLQVIIDPRIKLE